jgi:hypothetical protein
MLEFTLAPFQPGPVQQPVRVEGIPDALALAESETHLGAALAQRFAALRQLRGRGAVLAGQVLCGVFALGRHGRVQLEGLKVQLHVHLAAQFAQRRFQRIQADGAPRAGHVRNEIDLHAVTPVPKLQMGSIVVFFTSSITA